MLDILTRAGCFAAIILLGAFLRRIGFFKASDFALLSKITIRITLPAAIITSFAGKEVDPAMLTLALLGFGGGLIYMAVGFLINLRSSKETQAFDVLNTTSYGIGTFSLPFIQGFLGPVGVITTSLFDIGNAFICLGGAYSVATMIRDGKGFSLRSLGKSLFSSVPFVTYIIVITLCLTKTPFPATIVTLAEIIGNANPFMAMLMIGVGFQLSGNRSQAGHIAKILVLRYAVASMLALAYYFLLPFPLEVRQALVILAFSPVGQAVLGFTEQMNGDVGLSSAINFTSIICSTVLITVLLSVMLY